MNLNTVVDGLRQAAKGIVGDSVEALGEVEQFLTQLAQETGPLLDAAAQAAATPGADVTTWTRSFAAQVDAAALNGLATARALSEKEQARLRDAALGALHVGLALAIAAV